MANLYDQAFSDDDESKTLGGGSPKNPLASPGLQPLSSIGDPNIPGGTAPPPKPLNALDGRGAMNPDGTPYVGTTSPYASAFGDSSSGQQPLSSIGDPSIKGGTAPPPKPLQPLGAGGGPTAAPGQAGWSSGGDDVAGRFSSVVSQLKSTTDPAQQAVLKDKLARDVYGQLQQAGHDVQWDGDQIVVDGRRYVVGGAGIAAGEGAPNAGPAPTLDQPLASPQAGGFGRAPSGYDQAKWDDPNSDSAKYIMARGIDYNAMRQIPDEAGRKAFLAQEVQRIKPQLEAKGWKVGRVEGDRVEIGGNGFPMNFVDVVGDIEGSATPAWNDNAGAGGAVGGGGTDFSIFDQIFHDPPPRPGGGGGPAAPPPAAGWNLTGPTYTPGSFDDSDLAGLSADEILARIGPMTDPAALPTDYQAGQISNGPLSEYAFDGFGDLGDLGAGPTDDQTQSLVSQLLAHPESLDPRTIEMLKAKSKDELADMAKTDDEDLVAQGYLTGNADSNWIASERRASKGRRDNALVQSNRDIDIGAAQQNMADRRAAAGIGQSYADSKAGRNLAERGERFNEGQAGEGLKQASVDSKNKSKVFQREGEITNQQLRGDAADRNLKAAQQNIDNQFKSKQEKQAAVKLATDTQLAAAAQKGDRRALEQTFQQKAAELGQSADKLRQDYILGVLSSDTQRYGIDVGASVDRAKLSEQGREFQLDLILKLKALEQNDRQFGAQYGLDVLRTQDQLDSSAWSRAFG